MDPCDLNGTFRPPCWTRWAAALTSAVCALLTSACTDGSTAVPAAASTNAELVLETPTLLYRTLMQPPTIRHEETARSGESPTTIDLELFRAEAKECRQRIELARQTPALPGDPRLEERRAEVLARGRAEPVLFLEKPRFQGEVSAGLLAQRRRIEKTHFPRDTMLGILRHFKGILPELRRLVLRDGYFYTDDPAAARELSIRVGFEDLFREPSLELLRGSRQFRLERKEGLYHYADGALAGQRARLLLFDRVWVTGEDPSPPVHVDIRKLASVVGFEQLVVDHLGEKEIVASLLFGEEWVPALLSRSGPELELECLLIEAEDRARVGRAQDSAYRRAIAVAALRKALIDQVRMGLPFDEPRREVGQQDGKLRPRWEQAYLAGRDSYRFNGDRYSIFDDRGNPMSPQVCVDFITESLERASGMSYSKQGQVPRKVKGSIDFDELLGPGRRQELALRTFAKENPHMMRLYDYPMKEWEKYERVQRFFGFLKREKDRMKAGDIVIIRGRAAWDRYEEVHTHTFFIYESDPLTGMPLVLAGNSGKPRLVTWDSEMLRAPKRSIRHRIRLNTDWLYDHLVSQIPTDVEELVAPLVVAED